MRNPNGKYVTNNWLLGILVVVMLGAGGYFFTDAWAQMRTLQQNKVDKEQYKCDMARIEGKLDTIIDMHLNKGK